MQQHIKREKRLAGAIVKANSAENKRRAMVNYWKSYSAKQVALETARKKLSHALIFGKRDHLIDRMDLWQIESKEPAKLISIPKETIKGTQDFRYVLNFGLIHRARQTLLRRSLEAVHKPKSCQYLLRGGRDMAITRVKEFYAAGYTHVSELDINSAYHSFGTKELANYLGLPERVVETTLDGRLLSIEPSSNIKHYIAYDATHRADGWSKMDLVDVLCVGWRTALKGLTEGNCASHVACEMLLAWLCDKLPQDWSRVRLVNYADNFLIMATTAKDAHSAVELLREYMAEHPAAPPFTPITASSVGVSHNEPFPFLGYWLKPVKGELEAFTCERARSKLIDLRRKCRNTLQSPDRTIAEKADAINSIWHKQKAILNGYSHWAQGKNHIRAKSLKLLKLAFSEGVPIDLLAKPLVHLSNELHCAN